MSKRDPPNREVFDKLLFWLNPDREKAGEIHEVIRLRLIKSFASKGWFDAEDLADETINVVASRIDWLIANYVGNPKLYFYGVAKNIHRERCKEKPPPDVSPPDPPDQEIERMCSCLEKCLAELEPHERDLFMRYHEDDKQKRIDQRKQLADELGITRNALRVRIFHIRERLEKCIKECLEQLPLV